MTYTANQAFSSQSQEWYTPANYIEAARRVMGCINLDPASNEVADSWIQAINYYSPEKGQDALQLSWKARNIWLNPPFNQSEKFVNKLVTEYELGHFEQAIALVKFVPSYKWFEAIRYRPMVVTDHRVSFWSSYGERGKSSFDQSIAFVYFGHNVERFVTEFSQFGNLVPFLSRGEATRFYQQWETIKDFEDRANKGELCIVCNRRWMDTEGGIGYGFGMCEHCSGGA